MIFSYFVVKRTDSVQTCKNDCTRVDVVFDRYDGVSIKPGARHTQAGLARRPIRCTSIIDNADVPP